MLHMAKYFLIIYIFSISTTIIVKPQDAIFDSGFEDAADFVATFKSMTDASADVFVKLGKIGNGAFSLLKFAGPIGQLVHTGISLGLKDEESAELRAIRTLQRQITEQFDALSKKIDTSIARQQYADTMRDYEQKVSFSIMNLEHVMQGAAAAPDAVSMDQIKSFCVTTPHTPRSLLKWINKIVNLNCNLPTVEEAKTYAKARSMLTQIDALVGKENAGITNSMHFDSWKSDVLTRLMEMPFELANKHIDHLKNAFENSAVGLNFTNVQSTDQVSERLVDFFSTSLEFEYFHADAHRIGSEGVFDCLLTTISTRYEKRRVPLMEHTNIVLTDVARLQLLGVMCESFIGAIYSKEFDLAAQKWRVGEYDKLTREIAQALLAWTTSDLESAWPDVIIAHAILALKKKKNPEDDEIQESDYDDMALQIQREANQRGLDNYLHQVIVCPAWENNKYFLMKCKGDSCTQISDNLGVHVAITRFDENEQRLINRLELSKKQISQHRESLQSSIRNQLYQYGGTCDLNMLLEKSHVGQPFSFGNYLFGNAFWRNFVFLHNRKWLSSSCVIPIGLAGAMLQGIDAFDNGTILFDNGFLTDANIYQLILML